jgi:transposase
MRGADYQQNDMFSYVSPESRIPADHPLRAIRAMSEEAIGGLTRDFSRMYSRIGRPSIPPEKLLRALLLQMLYTVRSERQLMEQLNYNLLFRWFVGLSVDEEVWDASTFSKNRDRLMEGDIARKFFRRVVDQARQGDLLSAEHFTVDGTLLEAAASLKSFQRRDKPSGSDPDDPGNPSVNFHGEKRSNQTHESTTDPDALLARKGNGKEAKLSYSGNVLIENRHGLIVDAELLPATGLAERAAAAMMVERIEGTHRVTVAGDKGYDTRSFVGDMRSLKATPHVAQNDTRRGGSAIDQRTTRHAGYKISQQRRKRIEECFGWLKVVALLRKLRHRGIFKVGWVFTFAAAAFNLVRMRRLLSPAVEAL